MHGTLLLISTCKFICKKGNVELFLRIMQPLLTCPQSSSSEAYYLSVHEPHPLGLRVCKQQKKRIENMIHCDARLQMDYLKLKHTHVVHIEMSLK